MLTEQVLSRLSRINDVGDATAVGVVLEQQTGAGNAAITVPAGQVFLIDTVVVQADTAPAGIAAAFAASPGLGTYGIRIDDAAGSAQSNIEFLAFRRWQQTFVPENSPNWRNAPPGNVVVWQPKYPIPVPQGWSIKNLVGGEWANQIAVYGKFLSMEGARTAGYDVNTSSTDANRRYGVTSFSPPTAETTQIAGRTGKSLRILDVYVRMQPETGGATNKITLRQTDDRVIFSWTNNNPSDLLELKFSPDIFLKSGVGLESVATIAGTGSIVIVYEFVDDNEVPGDHWWGYVEPDLPTPTVSKVGTFSNAPVIGTRLVCYYPGLDSTKTSPTKGCQHIVRGYTFSIQKDTTAVPDQTICCLSSGTAQGTIKFTAIGVTSQSNVQISPVFTSTAHDQCVFGAVDNVNIPCKKDDGSIWVDTMAVGVASGVLSAATTPTTTDVDMDEWSWTVWGRTIPGKFSDPSNRGA